MKRLLFLLTLFVVLGMQAQQHVMTVDVSKPTARINPAMYGIFFEDINFGADGGLYAELVKNRSFEFPQPLVGWIPFGEVTVQDERPCFDRNPHYVRITNDGCLLRAGLDNEGYRGIGLTYDNEKENVSIPNREVSQEYINAISRFPFCNTTMKTRCGRIFLSLFSVPVCSV